MDALGGSDSPMGDSDVAHELQVALPTAFVIYVYLPSSHACICDDTGHRCPQLCYISISDQWLTRTLICARNRGGVKGNLPAGDQACRLAKPCYDSCCSPAPLNLAGRLEFIFEGCLEPQVIYYINVCATFLAATAVKDPSIDRMS